jgi:hypothetical protein
VDTCAEVDTDTCDDSEAEAVLEILIEVDTERVVVCKMVELVQGLAEANVEADTETLIEPEGEICGEADADTLVEADNEIYGEADAETLGEADGEICDETLAEKDDTSDEEPVTDCVKETFADLEPVDETDGLFETEIEPDDDPVFELKAEVVDI